MRRHGSVNQAGKRVRFPEIHNSAVNPLPQNGWGRHGVHLQAGIMEMSEVSEPYLQSRSIEWGGFAFCGVTKQPGSPND